MKPILLVLAAGMGSRYGGVKQIDAVGLHGECLLDFATFDARKAGFCKVVYIIRKDIEKDFRARLFDRVARNFDAEYVFQSQDSLLSAAQRGAGSARQKPWGTIHAVLCAEQAVNAPFAVINADDYYGAQAFATLGEHLSTIDSSDCTEHAMVGYVLGKTMSRSGSVSRGICTVKDGYLQTITENTQISYEGERIVSLLGEQKISLSGDECVSMNFFGFSQKAFEHFHVYWDEFIAKNSASQKAEALLPEAAGQIVTLGKGRIKVYTSQESWFGMTYPQDRENVRDEIARKIESGYYPARLWEN